MVVLGGNMRLKAMKEAGWKDCPIEVVDWPEDKQREFIIKDNVGFGDWDWDVLGNEWDAKQLEDWGLDIPDFGMDAEAVEDDFEVPEGGIETDIVLGDLFEIGEHRLLCGDSTDSDAVAKLMNGEKADMVFTDPPYGVDYSGANGKMKNQNGVTLKPRPKILGDTNTDLYFIIFEIIKNNCKTVAYVFCGAGYEFPVLSAIYQTKIEHISTLIWSKQKGSAVLGANYKPTYEMFFYLKIGKEREWGGSTTEWTVWDIDQNKQYKEHPTSKPIEIPFKAISNHKINSVFDLFLGSGSTMVAAHQLKRKCYGMELDPKYCQVIVDRMLKLDPSIEIKKNGEPYKNNELSTNG
jgi:DNA modification methylase